MATGINARSKFLIGGSQNEVELLLISTLLGDAERAS